MWKRELVQGHTHVERPKGGYKVAIWWLYGAYIAAGTKHHTYLRRNQTCTWRECREGVKEARAEGL